MATRSRTSLRSDGSDAVGQPRTRRPAAWQERLDRAVSYEAVLLSTMPVIAHASLTVSGPADDLLLRIACTLQGGVVSDEVAQLLHDEIPRRLEEGIGTAIPGRELRLDIVRVSHDASAQTSLVDPGSKK